MRHLGKLLISSSVLAGGCVFVLAGAVAAYDDPIQVKVETWSSPDGRGYVGVQAAGEWAVPAVETVEVVRPYYSVWDLMGLSQPFCHHYWVWVYRTADDEIMNPAAPSSIVTCEDRPGIAIRPEGYGDLSLYLDVAVDPVSAPARTERSLSAGLTLDWMDAIGGYLSAYVIHDSVTVDGWTVDFGDGTSADYLPDSADQERLAVTHRYEQAGSFEAIVTAHISGEAYAAFFTPSGAPIEQVVPFSVDISNAAAGISALPIEYVAPVVTVGASPSGTLPDGTVVTPDDEGHASLWWPRGLECDLFVRPIIEQEAFMRSGGAVVGGATTRLVSYRYDAGVNDASDSTSAGIYEAEVPIRIQWNTPLPGQDTYSVRLVLELETTYDDGTVRTSEVSGQVDVSVIYSAVSG